jgi:3-keto-L-gulonate-6-phosphate decarboxylase
MVKLQLALDFVKLNDALDIAEQVNKWVDWIEVGTPLIKAEGIGVVKVLKKRFPGGR